MKNSRKLIYLAGFLFSIPLALTSYINSSFLETYINEYYVGIVYIVASAIAIMGLLKMPKILNKLGNRFTILLFTFTSFFSLLLLAFSHSMIAVILGVILYFISTDFIIASLDIFIEDFSKNSNIGKFRGLYLMIINFAWVFAQAISGSIVAKSSFHGIYLFSAGFMFLVSIIFTIMLIPFVLLDYPLGRLSDKIGEKKLLIAGFLTTILFTLAIPFIRGTEVWIWAIILFGTRFGAATIEVMSESYFFKEVGERNADEISFFRNTYPLSFIIAPLVAIPVLLLVPSFKFIFFVLGIIMLMGLLVTLRLRDIK